MITRSRQPRQTRSKLHPIWTAIGCALLILLPAISWGLADLLVDIALEQFPELVRNFGAQVQGGWNLLLLKIGVTVIITVLLYLVFATLASFIYLITGGSKNAELASRLGSEKRR
jgi:hypothetical protein